MSPWLCASARAPRTGRALEETRTLTATETMTHNRASGAPRHCDFCAGAPPWASRQDLTSRARHVTKHQAADVEDSFSRTAALEASRLRPYSEALRHVRVKNKRYTEPDKLFMPYASCAELCRTVSEAFHTASRETERSLSDADVSLSSTRGRLGLAGQYESSVFQFDRMQGIFERLEIPQWSASPNEGDWSGVLVMARDWIGLYEVEGGRVGPEPTTDMFVAICYGEEVTVTPGNALIYDQTLPFAPLGRFGNGFLGRLECAQMPNPVLQGVSFIDTPGVLSGEKQRLKRGYEYQEVMSWFAEQAAMIIVFFDALKSDVSDELKQCIGALEEWSSKIHVVLNKADQVTTQELLRVNGALMWNLGKVCDTPEVTKVYVGSFWDGPLRNMELHDLFDREQDDLYRHIEQLPLSSSVQRINDLSKRARLVKVGLGVIRG
ncbi:unnamed protein product, partial [Prorocentrum cordatum]